jgi:hypothetical protein
MLCRGSGRLVAKALHSEQHAPQSYAMDYYDSGTKSPRLVLETMCLSQLLQTGTACATCFTQRNKAAVRHNSGIATFLCELQRFVVRIRGLFARLVAMEIPPDRLQGALRGAGMSRLHCFSGHFDRNFSFPFLSFKRYPLCQLTRFSFVLFRAMSSLYTQFLTLMNAFGFQRVSLQQQCFVFERFDSSSHAFATLCLA